MTPSLTEELASAAARLVVEEGMEYGPAKRKAARALGGHRVRTGELPSNDAVEDEVRAYLELFCADTQPQELAALRRLALGWMTRLAEFRPHLSGAAWRGTATRLSSLHIDLYCDDPKSTEIALINQGLRYETSGTVRGLSGEPIDVLSFAAPCPELGEPVTIHLTVRDLDELRGALKPDAQGRTLRGSEASVRRLLEDTA
jgi:hypothetical protein